jgi:hypothetical protein
VTSVSYERFLPEVLPYVRDCPDVAALNAIRNSCIEFCEKSYYLRHDCDDIDVIAGQSEYDLDMPSGYVVAGILAVRCYDRDLVAQSEDQLIATLGQNWQTYEGASPVFFTQLRPESIFVAPMPDKDEDSALKVSVALAPSRVSERIDSVIFEKWAEVIGFGARARLHDTPYQPYSDEAAAARFRAWFNSGCTKARLSRQKGLGRASLAVRMRKFY